MHQTNFVCLFSKCKFCLLDLSRFFRPELEIVPVSAMMKYPSECWMRGMALLLLLQAAASVVMLPNSTGWEPILDKYLDEEGDWWEAKQRGKRAISDSDAQLILDLHNKLRGQVYPPASNMEYMVSGIQEKHYSHSTQYLPNSLTLLSTPGESHTLVDIA